MTSYDEFKNFSSCVGSRHYTSTIEFKPDITFDKKTNKNLKLFRGVCRLFRRSKTKMVSDNTNAAEALQFFFESVSKAAKNIGKQ